MRRHHLYFDDRAYHDYYMRQAGGGEIPKFIGAQTQYGYGLGGLLRNLIRTVIPLGSRLFKIVKPVAHEAFTMAKPHLKEAVKEIGSAALRKAGEKLAELTTPGQSGSGRKRKRRRQMSKPRQSKRRKVVKKRKMKAKRKTLKKRKPSKRRRRGPAKQTESFALF